MQLSYQSLILELCQKTIIHQRRGNKKEKEESWRRGGEKWDEGGMNEKQKNKEREWVKGEAEVKSVQVLYSWKCWGVKCCCRLVWLRLSTSGSGKIVGCWLKTVAYLWGIIYSFFWNERYCRVVFLDWYQRVGVTQSKAPFVGSVAESILFPHSRPEMDCV